MHHFTIFAIVFHNFLVSGRILVYVYSIWVLWLVLLVILFMISFYRYTGLFETISLNTLTIITANPLEVYSQTRVYKHSLKDMLTASR